MGILRHELRRCIIFQLSQVPHLHENGGCPPVAAFVFLVVFVHQDRQRHLCGFVLGRNILAPVVVVNDPAVLLEHKFGNSAVVDSELAFFLVMLNPESHRNHSAVAVLNSNRTLCPHILFLRICVFSFR